MRMSRAAAAACGALYAFAAGAPARAETAPAAPAAQEAEKPPAADWPCKQILVETISPAAVWSGPPVDNVEWTKDESVVALVQKISARRTPIETAQKDIEAFASAAGADKNAKLTAVFAGAFETLGSERSQIIEGLRRFGRKQKALAATIRAENAAVQKKAAQEPPHRTDVEPANDPEVQKLQLDLRLFEEGRKSLGFACEAPTLVDQRIFAIARAVQGAMD